MNKIIAFLFSLIVALVSSCASNVTPKEKSDSLKCESCSLIYPPKDEFYIPASTINVKNFGIKNLLESSNTCSTLELTTTEDIVVNYIDSSKSEKTKIQTDYYLPKGTKLYGTHYHGMYATIYKLDNYNINPTKIGIFPYFPETQEPPTIAKTVMFESNVVIPEKILQKNNQKNALVKYSFDGPKDLIANVSFNGVYYTIITSNINSMLIAKLDRGLTEDVNYFIKDLHNGMFEIRIDTTSKNLYFTGSRDENGNLTNVYHLSIEK